jgi:hypothetical protein
VFGNEMMTLVAETSMVPLEDLGNSPALLLGNMAKGKT